MLMLVWQGWIHLNCNDVCAKKNNIQINLCMCTVGSESSLYALRKYIFGYSKCEQWGFWSDCANAHGWSSSSLCAYSRRYGSWRCDQFLGTFLTWIVIIENFHRCRLSLGDKISSDHLNGNACILVVLNLNRKRKQLIKTLTLLWDKRKTRYNT